MHDHRRGNRSRAGVACAFVLLALPATAASGASPAAERGLLDLRGQAETTGARLVLEGEWDFFPHQLIAPEEVAAARGAPAGARGRYAPVPGYWNRLAATQDAAAQAGSEVRLGGMGWGTYLLELRGLEAGTAELGIYLKFACTGYRLYHFGDSGPAPSEPTLRSGTVATERAAAVPGHQPQLAPIRTISDRQFVLVQVSNFDHRGGGLCAPPVIDRLQALEYRYQFKRVLDASIVGMLAVLMLYNMSVFWQRRQEPASFWLAALAMVMLSRTLATEAFFELLYGESSRTLFEWSYKTEYLTIALTGMVLARFLHHSFPRQMGRFLLRYTLLPGVLLVAFVLATPLRVYSRFVLVFDAWLVVGLIYVAWRLGRAWIGGVPFARLTCIGLLPAFLAGIYDMTVAESLTNSIYLTPYATILFIYVQGLIVAKRLSAALSTAQALSTDLETEVKRQTAELRQRTVELEVARDQLRSLSETDSLTGIYNRLYFDRQFEREWRRARRGGDRLAMLIVDIDHFKNVNDVHGHLVGDCCLQAVARSLAEVPGRPADFVARYGGEEFALVLPGVDREGAHRIAELIRQRIGRLGLSHEGEPIPLTVSIGVAAAVPTPGLDREDLISAADGALYRAKAEGRNRTVVAERVEARPVLEA